MADHKRGDDPSHNPADEARSIKSSKGGKAGALQPKRGAATGGRIRVKQIRSLSGRPDKHRRTIEALGLKYTQHAVVHDDTPAIRGMVQQVIHLVTVEPAE